MNIAMFTNTYLPHVGGVARSVAGFAAALRRMGHRVLVVAPVFPNMPAHETDVIRVPAVQRFNGSDFSVPMPAPGLLRKAFDEFRADVVHSHHPFLLGDTALRLAAAHDLPVVFTHHTRYEHYTHYVPGDSPLMRTFVMELVSGYANLCQAVVAPSQSIAELLRERGVTTPVNVIPTGVDHRRFASGDGQRMRATLHIPADATVVGHVGRLAPEKNPLFLTRAVCLFLESEPAAHFLLVGEGPSASAMAAIVQRAGVADRFHRLGVCNGQTLADAYRAMDVFAFASQSETQGMVLAEAMAAGVPVVALDGSGVREIVRDRENGRLLTTADEAGFADALAWVTGLRGEDRKRLAQQVAATAAAFSMDNTATRLARLYQTLAHTGPAGNVVAKSPWQQARDQLKRQWQILRIYGQAVEGAVLEPRRPADAKPAATGDSGS